MISDRRLVKTRRFTRPRYVGDPINTLRIFNEKEVDEVIVVDIDASRRKRPPDFSYIAQLASECFMPLAYGGGITSIDEAKKLFEIGVEKVCINSHATKKPALVSELANAFGSQSLVVSVDVRARRFGGYKVFTLGGRHKSATPLVPFLKTVESNGAGELLLTSVDRDGTRSGYDLPLLRTATGATSIPVIACGGAACLDDFRRAVVEGGASAVAAGCQFVFKGRHQAVLVSYPTRKAMEEVFRGTEVCSASSVT